MVQAAYEAGWCSKYADRPSTDLFYKYAQEALDAIRHATVSLTENY